MAPALAAPLAPGFAERVLWHDGLPAPVAVPERPLPAQAEVVIVGGGYCGMTAAWQLARRSRHAVVLETEAVGYGASSRNGGMVIPELKAGPHALEVRHGPLGRKLVAAVFDAFDLVESLVADGTVDCDYERGGGLLLAHHPRLVRELQEVVKEWTDDLGVEARFVPRDELAAEIGTSAYYGGLAVEKTGGLQPARFHAGLAQAALGAGAEVHEHTRALSIERAASRFRVVTSRGTIEAGDVLVATNAYADGVLPKLRRRVLPIGSFIIATQVLDPALAKELSPQGRMFYDTKSFVYYWRLSPDGRMAFGGRTSLAPTTVTRSRDLLYREMVRIHPQLAGVPLEYSWGGNVAITLDRLPHAGRIDGVAFATGCNGTGVALATWFGMRMAGWLSGEEDPPVFSRLRFPPIPLYSFRSAYLPLVGQWFRTRDRLGR
ncbi:MAG: NAD(P)/FAD-dependent oxidoreductase [Acidimicrobiia bacterium]